MTVQQLAERRYPIGMHTMANLQKRAAFTSGVELGMQFAEWASDEGWRYDAGIKMWERNIIECMTTPELFAIFIKSIESNK